MIERKRDMYWLALLGLVIVCILVLDLLSEVVP